MKLAKHDESFAAKKTILVNKVEGFPLPSKPSSHLDVYSTISEFIYFLEYESYSCY